MILLTSVAVPKLSNELAASLLKPSLKLRVITIECNRPLNELKEISVWHGLSLTWQKIFINEGWVGKPKALLHVHWEQGWIDESQCKESTNKEEYKILNTSCYTLNRKKNPITGNLDESMSLWRAIDKCFDFIHEETALQYLGSQLGIKVMLTPKFHCKFAGKKIEHNWAHAKAKMQRTSIREKRAPPISWILSWSAYVLNLYWQRSGYKSLHSEHVHTFAHIIPLRGHEDERMSLIVTTDRPSMQMLLATVLFRKNSSFSSRWWELHESFRTHQCALDFDTRMVQAALREKDAVWTLHRRVNAWCQLIWVL